MNPWYVDIMELSVLAALFIGIILLIVKWIRARKHHQPAGVKLVILFLDIIFFACSLLFVLSHSTYYKYNDWFILNSDIHTVMSRYGAFDKGTVQEGTSGRVGYYIYTDDGPVMPDHMKHYYWIYYDRNGTVYKVEEGLPPGG